jgi:hypothetical protein
MPQRMGLCLKRCLIIAVIGGGVGAALAACSTSADVTYGTYSFGPGYQSGQVYESRVYGEPQRGVGAESCRTIVRREADEFGRLSSWEETICE